MTSQSHKKHRTTRPSHTRTETCNAAAHSNPSSAPRLFSATHNSLPRRSRLFLLAGLIASACTGPATGQENLRLPPPQHQGVYSPPVHLAPVNVLRQQPTPAAPRHADRPQVAQTTAWEVVEDPFRELEQDLALPMPPADRISQTPARPDTRPNVPNRQSRPSQSVLGQQNQLPADESILQRPVPPSDPHTELPAARRQVNGANNRLRTPAHDAAFGPGGDSAWQDEQIPVDPDGRKSAIKDCEEYRELLLNIPISSVALDISPPRRLENQEPFEVYRDWTDIFGQPIISGTLVELRRGYAVIDTGNGLQKISVARLSENDLAAIADAWQFPKSCIVSADVFSGRCWMPQTMTWHASNLCHKPLFFEDVQLERYGHSDGPFMQPVRSTAHFLVSLVTMPYQSGIHPHNECQYALGYYRPGSCAPWLGYPIPISAKGAVHQAAFMMTGAYTIF